MGSRFQRCQAGALGLAAALVACSAVPDGEERDTADTDEDVAGLELQAVVYGVTTWAQDGAVWIRRRGEAPVLIEALVGERPDDVCVNPDGTGYVVWVTFQQEIHEDLNHRTQAIAVGEDWVSARAERAFPPGYNAVGCPLAWSPEAYIVNLTAETTYGPTPPDTRPYRVSLRDDGFTVEAVEGARAPWERNGPFILEHLPHPEEPGPDTEIVLWGGGVEPWPQVTWSAERGIYVRGAGPWWSLTRYGETSSISVVPTDDPERPPLVLVETSDPGVPQLGASYSPSGEYVAVTQRFEENRVQVEVLRLVGNAISQRRTVVVPPEDLDSTGSFTVADTGHILFGAGDGRRLYVAAFDGAPLLIAPTDLDPEHATIWGYWVEELDAVFVEAKSSGVRAFRLYSVGDGAVTPVQTGAGCAAQSVDGHKAFFACPDDSFEWADLSAPAPRTKSLDALTPEGPVRAAAALPFEWAGLPWYDLLFLSRDGTGYIRTLYQADTQETMMLGEPGFHVLDAAFLPARSD